MSSEPAIQLSQAMSDLSEECWCAGWLMGTEDTLPALCWLAVRTGKSQHWGQGTISLEQANQLITLADELGSWADMDGNPYQPNWKHVTEWLGELAQPPKDSQ